MKRAVLSLSLVFVAVLFLYGQSYLPVIADHAAWYEAEGSGSSAKFAGTSSELTKQVEIVRTANGVPHIRAENLKAAGFALAWLQLEDYGTNTAMNILRASGRAASVNGYASLESDFAVRRERDKTQDN